MTRWEAFHQRYTASDLRRELYFCTVYLKEELRGSHVINVAKACDNVL